MLKNNKLPLQKEFCKDNEVMMFAPLNGVCYCCGELIEDDDKHLITGCNHCNRSFVD